MPVPEMKLEASSTIIRSVKSEKFDAQYVVEEIESPSEKANEFHDVKNSDQIVQSVIDHEDDPSLNTWTFRTFFIGIGLAIFGGVLQCIFYFKPQTIFVNGIFLMLIAYVLGIAMARFIPTWGWFRYLNPHPFNKKEHAAATIMATSAATCALAIEVLAVQKLWYSSTSDLNGGISIFMIFSSQLLGYGLCGLLRKVLIYPTKMVFPNIIPQVTTIHALHNDKNRGIVAKQLKWFYIVFGIFFFFEIVPEWFFTLLIGFSIPCLAAPRSRFVSRVFGGTNGNEGLGLLSFCFDWNYVSSTANPMAIPLVATMNNIVGYILCIAIFIGVYYGNIWKAKNFPFLSQSLYYEDSSPGNYNLYNQTLILDEHNKLDVAALEVQGIPYMTPTYVVYLIGTNLSVSATFTHMYLFHSKELAPAFSWMKGIKNLTVTKIKAFFAKESLQKHLQFWKPSPYDTRINEDGTIPELYDDLHFREMLKYKEVPQWWYAACTLISTMIALICLYKGNTGLPWWMLFIGIIMAFMFTLVLGGLVAVFGFGGTQMQTVIQLIGSYMHPGTPLANMYFTLYGYNSVQQAFSMLQDLKQGQYLKLSPRSTFACQLMGTFVGAVFNYIMMQSIVKNQGPILKSIEGSAIWSGQNVQQYNTQGVAWGALSKYMFSVGRRYEWVPLSLLVGFAVPLPFYAAHRLRPTWGFQNVNVPILVWYIGWLCVGVNSSITSYFIVALFSQFYLRRYRPEFFKKYNYIIAAAMTGGAQVMVFILSFAVAGASGTAHNFPTWWGNYLTDKSGNSANYDHCKYVD